MALQLEVVARRGSIEESRHVVQLALVDADGKVLESSSEPQLVTTFRSAAKPFQLLPFVERGHAERWGFGDEQLAVMTSSHTGSRAHLALVAGILERIGRTPADLVCGYHDPSDPESREDVFAHAAARTALYNNCSGKHAGMLALALAEGWAVEDYHRPEHPMQQLMQRTIAEICGVPPESMPTAIDGCSLVVFALPLAAMARGYARLAAAVASPGAEPRGRALSRIGRAMSANPLVVEGHGRVSTALMQVTEGRLIAKGGAEGLQLVALPERRAGLALKCEDGADRAVGPAVVAVLERLGLLTGRELDRLAAVRDPAIPNAGGLVVGDLQARLRASATA